jgi:tetratricopeptide (TPR) repeat protein
MPAPSPAPRLLLAAGLALAVLAAFWPVLSAEFINHDDDFYVTRNPIVQRGLTAEGVRWAWTATEVANWHPVTWMAHMLDWQLFGAAPAGHHATSLALHVLNTLLLFSVLDRMTGAPWRSALVAALFGLHPLHVESVAWVSERKDVLSTCFWFCATLAWVAWLGHPRAWRYALAAACLALGLAAKPMLVTLPATLLLLDWWPLGRLTQLRPGAWALVREKLPLAMLVVASSAATVAMQSRGHAVASFAEFPLGGRVENAIVAYATYLWKTVWPIGLVLPYAYLGDRPRWEVGACLVLLAVVTAAAVRLRRARPYLLVGWLWYLGTLVPVIGLVQVGAQPFADRYTYVPLVGVFLAAAWALPAAAPRAVGAAAAGVLLVLGVLTHAQARRWHDSVTLFTHTLAVEERNPVAHTLLGMALAEQRDLERAVGHFERALELRPAFSAAHVALGAALAQLGRADDAVGHFEAALAVEPTSVDALNNLGRVLLDRGRIDEAIARYEAALALAPDRPMLHANLGMALGRRGRLDEARAALEQAVALDPTSVRALDLLGGALIALGRPADGLSWIDRALALDPTSGRAHASRAAALVALGRRTEAQAAVAAARANGVQPPAALLRALEEERPRPR